jgi:DNA-binding NarL/FixJ family response regulator
MGLFSDCALTEILLDQIVKSVPKALTSDTPREAQVCQGILLGKKAELIAHDLRVSVTTVATYRQRAYQKLGISSKGALFALCRQV